jgi:hypothetical protein
MRGINDFTKLLYTSDCCVRQRLTDERITLPAVPAGTYTFKLIVKVDGQEQEGYTTLTLGTRPSEFVDVVLTPPQRLACKLVRNADLDKPRRQLTVVLLPVNDMTNRTQAGPTDAADNVVFDEMKPGAYRWGIHGLNEDQYAELRVNGQLVPGNFVEIPPGAPPALEFRVLEGAASIRVQAEDADFCVDTSLVVLAAEPSQTPVAAKGAAFGCEFVASGLRPGEYDIALVRLMEQGEESDPLFRSRLAGLKRVRLERSERARMSASIQTATHEF